MIELNKKIHEKLGENYWQLTLRQSDKTKIMCQKKLNPKSELLVTIVEKGNPNLNYEKVATSKVSL